MKEISEILRAYMQQENHCQVDIAHRLKVSQSTINNWLNNKKAIGIKHYPAIAKLCNINLEEIIPKDSVLEIKVNGNKPEKISAQELYQDYVQSQKEYIQSLKVQLELFMKQVEDLKTENLALRRQIRQHLGEGD